MYGKEKSIFSAVLLVLGFLLATFQVTADPSAKISGSVKMQGFGWNSQSRGTPSKWYRLIEQRSDS
jgi:hypothetical protein